MPSDPARISEPIKLDHNFELDPRAFTLRRGRRSLKLERIPMELLLLLVEQRGSLVSREMIVERIWGSGVFLDTDNSINGAIRKIRQVLKDDPDDPHFVQTVPGKGYRFIASAVRQVEPPVPAPPVTSVAAVPAETRRIRWRWAIISAIVLVLIGAPGAYLYWSRSHPTLEAHQRPMLAVLPFENLTGDQTQDYFSDGMTEEMITQLGRIDSSRLGVIARTSVMHYKNSQQSLDQIARELGVQYVLEGSVRRDAGRVRITAQLIQVKDQTHLWAQQYDRQLKDLLALQDEIARQISGEIQSALGNKASVGAGKLPPAPVESEAYDLYLKGLFFWNKRTGEALRQAIGYFQQATQRDPNYAPAYAGLADSYALIGSYTGAPAGGFMVKARAAAQHALELDSNLPEAHTALALIVQNYDFDWKTAEKEFNRAIEINPNYATAHQWYAEHLMWQGRFDEALRQSERARQLDPLSLIIASDNGVILLYSRQYDRAITQFRSVLELDPNFSRAQMIRYAYLGKGMSTEAASLMERVPVTDEPWYWAECAVIYGGAGRKLEAQRALQRLLHLRQPVSPTEIANAYMGLGDKEEAMNYLELAYAQHSGKLTALKVDPVYDPLREDARFQELLQRVGLAN